MSLPCFLKKLLFLYNKSLHRLQCSEVCSSLPQSEKFAEGFLDKAAYFHGLILALVDLFDRRERLLIQRIQKLQAKQAGGVRQSSTPAELVLGWSMSSDC